MTDYIRPFAGDDSQVVKMLVGQGVMEGLARANSAVYTHPLSLIAWPVLALVVCQQLGWLPVYGHLLTYHLPLIGFALTAVPFLAIVEYLHRPKFTARMRRVIGAPDMVALERYYGRNIWVFEHNKEVVGVVCLDMRKAGQPLQSVLGDEEGALADKGVLKDDRHNATRDLAQIRHLDVDLSYRHSGVATELLITALDQAFETAQRVVVLTNPLGSAKVFTRLGFTSVPAEDKWEEPEALGLLARKGQWIGVERDVFYHKRDV